MLRLVAIVFFFFFPVAIFGLYGYLLTPSPDSSAVDPVARPALILLLQAAPWSCTADTARNLLEVTRIEYFCILLQQNTQSNGCFSC